MLNLIQLIKYTTLSKLKNLSKTLYYYYLPIKHQIKHPLPISISIEPTDFCQLECPQCPVGMKKKHEGNLINDELVYKTIDELESTLFQIIFYFQGEPLLNKNLEAYIKYANKKGIYTSTSTNGQLLTSDRAKTIVESNLDSLIVSLDGTTQNIYELYRKGGNIDKVINGVKEINRWKKELKTSTPRIELQFIVLGTNEHQIKNIKQLAKELNTTLKLKSAQIYNYKTKTEFHTNIPKYSRYLQDKNGNYRIKNKLRNRCWRMWSGSVLNVKGEVLPCCFDKSSNYSYGNVSDESWKKIIQHKKASDFRKSIFENRRQYQMCRNCTEK